MAENSKIEIQLYRPSNGTEGECFMADWCNRCSKDSEDKPCEIIGSSMAFKISDPEYPNEWRYDEGRPICTAFVDESEGGGV